MIKAHVEWVVRKRDGRIVQFDDKRIEVAIQKAFRAELGVSPEHPLEETVQEEIRQVTQAVMEHVGDQASTRVGVEVERIQDVVELHLMRRQHYKVARRYIIYREEQARVRALSEEGAEETETPRLHVLQEDGSRVLLNSKRIRRRLSEACEGLEDLCSVDELIEEVYRQLHDDISPQAIAQALILAARSRIEREPAYDTVAARLKLMVIYRQALGSAPESCEERESLYRSKFQEYLEAGIEAGRLSPDLSQFDADRIAAALHPERDHLFRYLGLQTIYDRYLLHIEGRRIETPQYFWMRVAMGLALNEGEDKEERAISFYEVLSKMLFTSATPTLFNSGTLYPQLSSCYLTTVMDDLDHIFKSISDNAKLSKWAGGLGNDWTNIRATNAHIHGTNGQSQGVIPFLKVVNDTAVAVNQGGKRKGAVCAYLEPWHLDIEEFLDLRKNTGDDRRRTHDMHTAVWIPDLLMKRVRAGEDWTLFSPDEAPDLHDLVGQAFETRYLEYEQMADEGKLRLHRRLSAVELWRKILTRLFETGHPWITWKDPSNIRSPQDHAGVVHSSNLCTEILLNTSKDETAVCNLGSVNLGAHIVDGQLDLAQLEQTVRTAVRMLDNVIDINFYPTEESHNANRRHRPIGLGLMGFQDALLNMDLCYASEAAVEFADRSMEAISYYALLASSELAAERGCYSSYQGSKWDRGILPIDSIDLLEQERGEPVEMDRSVTMDWQVVRNSIAQHGMRNSNVMAIAPTATISTIIGVTQSIEPSYAHLYVKSNLSGEFTQVNARLVEDLKSIGMWNSQTLDALKYFDGSVQLIEGIPERIKLRYLTSFEIDSLWLIECASRRQKWIDMGQSLNLYMAEPSGKKLNDMYFIAWSKGLKTTYYLRTRAATQVEKSTLDVNRFGIQPRWMKSQSDSADIQVQRTESEPQSQSCSLDGECEACQ